MKRIRIALMAALTFLLEGCLTFEIMETRLQLQGEGKPAVVTIDYLNISSDGKDTTGLSSDFTELLNHWRGDQFLLDRANDGMIVKSREVFIDNGKVVGRETNVVKDLKDLHDFPTFWVANGERVMLLDKDSDVELTESNGRILRTENNTLVVWPESASDLRWTQHNREFSASRQKNRQLMLQMVREYLAKPGPAHLKN